ncbi:hypothetical protein Z043_113083, partial [Scleropages formosus]
FVSEACQAHRVLSTQTEGELRITQILKEKFPQATSLKVAVGQCMKYISSQKNLKGKEQFSNISWLI